VTADQPAARTTVTATATATATATVTATASASPDPAADRESMSEFRRAWYAHTSQLDVDPTGHVHERVGDGCCTTVLEADYVLSDLHREGGSWVATATITRVTAADPAEIQGQPLPAVGETRQVRVQDGFFYGLGKRFCDQAVVPGQCGA
jgi:hypothetical protein